MLRIALAAVLFVVACSACGTSSTTRKEEPSDAGGDSAPVGQCNAVTAQQPDEGAAHAEECSTLSFLSNPPSSGTHYGVFPAFGVYATELSRGYWVHALEHGGIVFSYNCGAGCADDIAAAILFIENLDPEPLCVSSGQLGPRIILTPDSELDTRWAASSWGYTLRADCFDPQAFGAFAAEHVGRAPENICGGTPGLETRCR
ncbi:MAG TPA: DUF3105 domain-containing protein [Polyangiaceae bacterium]|nr:DUF3105 domain-containing protein [Polyangiaceae bacterium]